jgi:hypothetical protein
MLQTKRKPMSTTLLDTLGTPVGEFTVMTKSKAFLIFGNSPHTAIMPNNPIELGRYGIKLDWQVSGEVELAHLHKAVLNIVKEKEGLSFLLALRDHIALLRQLPHFEFSPLVKSGLLEDMRDQLPPAHEAGIKLIATNIKAIR